MRKLSLGIFIVGLNLLSSLAFAQGDGSLDFRDSPEHQKIKKNLQDARVERNRATLQYDLRNFVVTQVSEDEIYDVKGDVVYKTATGYATCAVTLYKVVADGDAVAINCPGLNSPFIKLVDPVWSTNPVAVLIVDTPGYASLEIERRVSKVISYDSGEDHNEFVDGKYDGGK